MPLSDRCVEILRKLEPLATGPDGFVFPGRKPSKLLSPTALTRLLRRMKLNDLTVHGFRATFKTWASERTSFQNEIVEAALAHVIGDLARRYAAPR